MSLSMTDTPCSCYAAIFFIEYIAISIHKSHFKVGLVIATAQQEETIVKVTLFDNQAVERRAFSFACAFKLAPPWKIAHSIICANGVPFSSKFT
jgi:hypothetical protein